MDASQRLTGVRCVGEPEATPKRDAEGGSRRLPCPKVITPKPYCVSVLPTVGRASVTFVPPNSSPNEWYSLGETEVLLDPFGQILAERSTLPDLERALRQLERNNRRARRSIEDYMVHNGLTKMWTLTYAKKTWSRRQVVEDLGRFFETWRRYMGRAFPYAWVIEEHKDGSYHVHLAVHDGLYTDKKKLQEMWGHGIVRFDRSKKISRGVSKREVRRLATYLTKYIAKDLGDELEKGSHRYEVAQGFSPRVERRYFATKAEGLAFIAQVADEVYPQVWCYLDSTEWVGPAVWCYESP